jgi:hypothetical protein
MRNVPWLQSCCPATCPSNPLQYIIITSSGDSCHKNENQPVRHIQWSKSYPIALIGKVGPSPMLYISFYCDWIATCSATSTYMKAPHFPVHPEVCRWIGPGPLHKAKKFLLPRVKRAWPCFGFLVLPSAIILQRKLVHGIWNILQHAPCFCLSERLYSSLIYLATHIRWIV